MKKGGLGKSIKDVGLDVGLGIGALIPETAENADELVRTVRLSQIEPNPEQPDHIFDGEKLEGTRGIYPAARRIAADCGEGK